MGGPERPRVLVLNGPNLNMLGTREPAVYGTQTLRDVEALVTGRAQELGLDVDCSQSNHEGVLIDTLHAARSTHAGLVLNAGGLTHTSVVLRDAVAASELPFVEVHITNVHAREPFRHTSLLSDLAQAVIVGAGVRGYVFGLEVLHDLLRPRP
ncbi:3-dehydroquinate dehydratase 1 [Modestobacter italicus]|uniref:3-dehydroquinate dehydratase n=1 Tax=Modestobacter italicus (strain DSM 44449 / CECT 9708 / BC 501) TaxID=2732864 RepID=I4EYA8_MODI5|nr:type II 3-dehydroquinate dehydratase [Modestobacter marinus]CCH88371.1 3-dehydroquinate dehydratase 1 [Modestobacter marinus]